MMTRSNWGKKLFMACSILGGVVGTAVCLFAQSLVFTSPGVDTVWRAGTRQTIRWTIRIPVPSMGSAVVHLSCLTEPGGSWTEIGETEAFRQRFEWAIPSSVSGKAMIRADWHLPVPMTFNSPSFQIRPDSRSLKRVEGGPMSSKARAASASDYRLDPIVFQDRRPLSEGILYSPKVLNDMRLLVRIFWNKATARAGIQCHAHSLTIIDDRGVMILNPAAVPAPDDNGWISMPVHVRIPMGLRENSLYSFRVRFQPADRDCDADSSNNERDCQVRLIRMSGNDLVVRIVEAEKYYLESIIPTYGLRIKFQIMNVSGTQTLRRVSVYVGVKGGGVTTAVRTVENLQPGVWQESTVHFYGQKDILNLSGEEVAIVTVDPVNEIEELREDNNQDGKRFRW